MKKKLLGIILAVAMVLCIAPMSVFAGEVGPAITAYDSTGTKITDLEAAGILLSGKKVTIDNFVGSRLEIILPTELGDGYAMEIELKGESKITELDSQTEKNAFLVDNANKTGSVTFSGDGSLEVSAKKPRVRAMEFLYVDVIITGGTFNVSAENNGAKGEGDAEAIDLLSGNLIIQNGTVNANAKGEYGSAIVINDGDIFISGGKVTAKSADYLAIDVAHEKRSLNISGGEVIAESEDIALSAVTINFSGSCNVEAKSKNSWAVNGEEKVTFNLSENGKVHAVTNIMANAKSAIQADTEGGIVLPATHNIIADGAKGIIEDIEDDITLKTECAVLDAEQMYAADVVVTLAEVPKTGDRTNFMLFGMLALLALAGIIACVRKGREH